MRSIGQSNKCDVVRGRCQTIFGRRSTCLVCDDRIARQRVPDAVQASLDLLHVLKDRHPAISGNVFTFLKCCENLKGGLRCAPIGECLGSDSVGADHNDRDHVPFFGE